MIDLPIEERATKIAGIIRHLGGGGLAYAADYTFESIPLLDFILDSRFDQTKNSSILKNFSQTEILCHCAAYLGLCLYRIWEKALPNSALSLIETDDPLGVELKAKGGDLITEFIKVDLLESIVLLQSTAKNGAAYTKEHYIPFGLELYPCLYSAYGILLGIHPLIKGTWETKLPFIPVYVNETAAYLAQNAVSKIISQNPTAAKNIRLSSFERAISMPPLGFDEVFLGARGVGLLIDEYGTDDDAIRQLTQLAFILSESPHPQYAQFAYIIHCALNEQGSLDFLTEFALTFPFLVPQFKPAVDTLRSLLPGENGGISDWPTLLVQNETEKALANFQNDISSGLAPCMALADPTLILDKRFSMYLETVDRSLIPEAYHYGNSLLSKAVTPEIIIQHANICIHYDHNEEARQLLSSIQESQLSNRGKALLLSLHLEINLNSKQQVPVENIREILQFDELSLFEKKRLLLLAIKNHSLIECKQEYAIGNLLAEFQAVASIIGTYLINDTLKQETPSKVPRQLQRQYWSPYLFWAETIKST